MVEPAALPRLLRARAADAEGVAIAVEGRGTLTYGSWERRSDAQARGLQRAGVRPGQRVALLFDAARWTDYAVTYLAVHKAAAVAVPLRADLPEIELRHIIRDSQAATVIAPEPVAARAPGTVMCPGELEDGSDEPFRADSYPATSVAEILYTSRPLGPRIAVPRSHHTLLATPAFALEPRAASQSLLHAFPVGSVPGQDALCASLQPAPLRSIVLPAFDPEAFCELLSAGSTRACALHPFTAHALLASGALARHDVAQLERLILSSGRVSAALLLRLTAALPRTALLLIDVLGGPPWLRTVFTHDRSRPGAVGRPSHGSAAWVTNEAGAPVGPGEVGEVWARAPAGEGAEPLETERHPDGGAPTGRLGYLDDDGLLYVVSHKRDVVRHRRATVSRSELESALREHPAVVDAAVLGVPDDRSGGELGAAVVTGASVSAAELQAQVHARLGEGRAPERVFFVDELPRNGSGALLRRELRRRLEFPSDARVRGGAPAVVEEAVAAIWRRVLGQRDVGPDDDFFELGGDHFAATSVLSLLEDAFEVRVSMSGFLDAPTAAGLACAVEALRSGDRPTVGDTPLAPAAASFAQEGMLWHECFAPGCQNLPGLARRFKGPLDLDALSRSVDEIVRRHGALRTTFVLREGRPVQVVRPHRPLELPIRDLSGLSAAEREAEVERLVAEAGRRPFDLVTGPLFEPALLRLGDDDHVLVIRTHHAVFDDWSVGVFRRELAALYPAYARGEAPPLPELPVQFDDFSRGQRRRLAGAAGARQLEFWRRELAGAPLTTQLPVDDPGLPAGSPQRAGEPVSVTLPEELRDGLRALARGERVTVYMTMLAAFGVLVHRYTRQQDLLLATVVANRNRTELEGAIGCFTKKVPLRLRLFGDPTFTEVLARTRVALLGALANQDLPFEAVVQDVLGAPAAAHGLVPHVVLMFQGVTPRQELDLPRVESAGYETGLRAGRAHFMAADDGSADGASPPPWGAGLYLGTFVILSLIESPEELSLVARGAFHAPAVRELMMSYRALLADVTADPARRVSQLTGLDERGAAEGEEQRRAHAKRPPPDTIAGAFTTQLERAPDPSAGRLGPMEGGDLRGFRVDPARIRSALVGCPGVRDAAVALHPDERGDARLTAYVVPDGRPPTLAHLRAYLWSRLPGYAWPSSLLAVPQLAPEGDADVAGKWRASARSVPQSESSPEQTLLCALWAEVLDLERVSPRENYWQAFSFLEVLARAREAGIPVAGEDVTANRTLKTLAGALATARRPSQA